MLFLFLFRISSSKFIVINHRWSSIMKSGELIVFIRFFFELNFSRTLSHFFLIKFTRCFPGQNLIYIFVKFPIHNYVFHFSRIQQSQLSFSTYSFFSLLFSISTHSNLVSWHIFRYGCNISSFITKSSYLHFFATNWASAKSSR